MHINIFKDQMPTKFCQERGLPQAQDPRKYIPRPASPEEAGLFYALPPERDEELGAVGHVRMDFGRSGTEFWHTWWPRGPEELNTQEFKDELGEVVDELRRSVLKDLSSMTGYCKMGDYAKCEKLYAIGSLKHGGFAEYTKMPAQNLVHLPDNVSYEEGALLEPSAVALHALYKTHIKMGDEVAVVGCGTIGEMLIYWAKLFGVKVYAFDINDDKLKEAKELGADVVINTTGIEPMEALSKYTIGVDIAFESAGNPITEGQVLSLTKKGGEVVYVGLPYGDVTMPRNYFEKITRNELHVIGAFGVTSAPFPGKEWITATDAMARGTANIKSIISHRAKLSEGPAILDDIMEHPAGYKKVMLFPDWDSERKEG